MTIFRPKQPASTSVHAAAGAMRWNYDRAELIADGVVHGVGVFFGLVAATVLIVLTAVYASALDIVVVSVYVAGLLAMLVLSATYNLWPVSRAKWVLRRFDHSAIYLLIAGTYTPFLLITLRGPLGWTLFGLQWGMAICGVLFKSLTKESYEIASTAIYALMGWMGVLGMRTMYASLHFQGVLWIVAGGLLYTLGIIFFAMNRRYCHTVWHLFVLAGSICHFYAVLHYIVLR